MAAKPTNSCSQPVSASQGGWSSVLVGRVADRLDFVEVDGFEQVLAGREVAVEGADADPGAAGDVLERGAGALLGERLARGGDQLLVVAARVGALRPRREGGDVGGVRVHLNFFRSSLTKRRQPPYSALTKAEATSELPGGPLHFITEFPAFRKGLSPHDFHRSGAPGQNPSRLVLAIILGCYLMIILDVSVVITALPSIHSDLGFSTTGLSWVQNAYTLTFGGLLLLGARAGDILGRRRVFVAGIALFTVASMLGGLAQSPAWLLGARALQGVGAAIAAPVDARPAHGQLPRGPRAHPRGRLLQRRRRRRRQRRPRARRRAHHLGLLALGPLHQRPDRHRR